MFDSDAVKWQATSIFILSESSEVSLMCLISARRDISFIFLVGRKLSLSNHANDDIKDSHMIELVFLA